MRKVSHVLKETAGEGEESGRKKIIVGVQGLEWNGRGGGESGFGGY